MQIYYYYHQVLYLFTELAGRLFLFYRTGGWLNIFGKQIKQLLWKMVENSQSESGDDTSFFRPHC